MKKKVRKGANVWLECQTKSGPFPDERLVLIELDHTKWAGFINVRWLKDQDHVEGSNEVLATISSVENGNFSVIVPGESPSSDRLEGRVEDLVEA